MIVKFQKFTDLDTKKQYFNLAPSHEKKTILLSILKINFTSINVEICGNTVYFAFNDQSDEAFFLLWSNGGKVIEI